MLDIHCSAQIKVFIEGLISFNQDIPQFKEHIRDFIVQIRVRELVPLLCRQQLLFQLLLLQLYSTAGSDYS